MSSIGNVCQHAADITVASFCGKLNSLFCPDVAFDGSTFLDVAASNGTPSQLYATYDPESATTICHRFCQHCFYGHLSYPTHLRHCGNSTVGRTVFSVSQHSLLYRLKSRLRQLSWRHLLNSKCYHAYLYLQTQTFCTIKQWP